MLIIYVLLIEYKLLESRDQELFTDVAQALTECPRKFSMETDDKNKLQSDIRREK